MADGGDDLFLFGDDFEAILDILDEDEVLQEQFLVPSTNYGYTILQF